MSTTNHPRQPATTFRALANQLPPLEPIDEPAPLDQRGGFKMSVGTPSKPLFGTLPLLRWIPQDCHSFMDYGNGLAMVACSMATDDKRAALASVALSSVLGVSAVTDYRISVAKLIPIETHEVLDHVWGLTAIAAPFVLGYWKTAPKIAMAHIGAGVFTILGSLLTDYRAYSRRTSARATRRKRSQRSAR
jgi:hypothetical protein